MTNDLTPEARDVVYAVAVEALAKLPGDSRVAAIMEATRMLDERNNAEAAREQRIKEITADFFERQDGAGVVIPFGKGGGS